MTDLGKLIEAVEAGTASTMRFEDTLGHISSASFGSADQWAELAYHGSLDAALRLHEALLPGWEWTIDAGDGASVECRADFGTIYSADIPRLPARSWLLAILRALAERGE